MRSLKRNKHLNGAIVATTAALIGLATLSLSGAATFDSFSEPEIGVLAGNAAVMNDTTTSGASGGKSVRFGAQSGGSPSGETMPVGNLTGWRQILAEDFKTAAASSSFDNTYANSWCGYDDGTGGKYFKSQISAHDGMMDVALDGVKGAAGAFGDPSFCWGSKYGRYSMRVRAVNAANNGTAVMLWPSSDIWGDGEIDYPEGNFNDNLHIFHHPMNCTDCGSSDGLDSGASWYQWHTVTTEWQPGSVKYYLDGQLIKTVTHDVPATDHRYMFQVAPNGPSPQTGNLQIDWVTMYTSDSAATATTSDQPSGPAGNWTSIFTDEFNGTSIDRTKWSDNWFGGTNMNGGQVLTSNLSFSNGNLDLSVASNQSGAVLTSNPNNGGGINGGFEFGINVYVEARILFPGNGATVYNWPAWWTDGQKWPADGEADIFEGLGTATSNYHYADSNGQHVADNSNTISGTWSSGYHTYGLYRQNAKNDIYWDGKLVRSYATHDNGAPHFLLLTNGPGYQTVTGSASQMKVDYVRAWRAQ